MEGSTRNTINNIEQLEMFYQQRNESFAVPILNKNPVDLLKLKKLVKKFGGYEKVFVI